MTLSRVHLSRKKILVKSHLKNNLNQPANSLKIKQQLALKKRKILIKRNIKSERNILNRLCILYDYQKYVW